MTPRRGGADGDELASFLRPVLVVFALSGILFLILLVLGLTGVTPLVYSLL